MKIHAFLQNSAIAALVLISSVGIGLAQQQKKGGNFDPDQMADRQVSAMKDRLKLTDEQVPKVKAIIVDSMKKQGELFQKYGRPQQGQQPSEEMMNEMRKVREESTKKMAEVLTKDQMDEYQKMMTEMRGQRGGQGKQGKQQPNQ
jgi:hypothetical protein